MEKEEEVEYEKFRENKFEENLIKPITFENLRKKNQYMKCLLTKINQQKLFEISGSSINFQNASNVNALFSNSFASYTDSSSDNDEMNVPINDLFLNDAMMIDTNFPKPENCKKKGI